MSKTIKVFISSRFKEFKELREKIAKEKFSKLDVGLELNMLDYREGIADARSPAIMSIEEANSSDIFILLLGETYKEILDDKKSYTHQEYDSAIENGLQILAFPIGDCYDFKNPKLSDNSSFREFQDAVLINNDHTTAPFIGTHYNVDDVYDIIYKSLQKCINQLINKGLNQTNRLMNRQVQKICTEYYLNDFKTISLLIEDDKKTIDDIYVNLAIIREEKEEDIKDKSKLLDRDKIINSYEEIYKPKEPIAIEELIEKSSKFNSAKALIYGKAGIGKTTFCKYIAYRWAKGELYSEFDNIVYIALREWKDDGLESIIKKIYFEEKHKNEAIEIDQSKTLFLFDGYDELSDTSLLHGAIKKYNLQNYIITSRPYGYRKSDFDVNEVFETIGFTDENVTDYIDKFFEEQSHKINLKNFLKQNINIKHIAYIPLMLEMICSLWREKAKNNQSFLSPMTMTELYSEVIEYIFFEYSETNNTAYIQEREDEIFDYLGKIAFEGLKRQVIVLDKSIIKEKKEFFVDYVLKIGFLKSNRKHRNSLMNSYEFPHLTFQEYFSALYVSKLSKEDISEVIREYKFYPYMQVFFAFLGGLIEDKEFLVKEIESKPRDITGLYEFLLILNLLSQAKREDINLEVINKNLVGWLRFLIENQLDSKELLLEKLKIITHIITKNTYKDLIAIVKDKNIDFRIRQDIIRSLIYLEIKNKEFINILELNDWGTTIYVYREDIIKYFFSLKKSSNYFISIIKNKNINSALRTEMAEKLVSLNIKSKEFINSLIEIVKDNDNDIDMSIKRAVINSLIKMGIGKKYFFKDILKIIKNENIDVNDRIPFISIVERTEKDDIKLFNLLIELLNNNLDKYINDNIIESLRYSMIKNNIFLNYLIRLVKEQSTDIDIKVKILQKLFNLGVDNNELRLLARESMLNKNIDMNDKIILARILYPLGIRIDSFVYDYIQILKDENISHLSQQIWSRTLPLEIFNYHINDFIKLIKDESVLVLIRKGFISKLSKNKKSINNLIKIMKNKNTNISIKREIAKSLFKLEIMNKDIIHLLLEEINHEGMSSFELKEIFEPLVKQILYDTNIKQYLKINFIKFISVKTLFECFDKYQISLNTLYFYSLDTSTCMYIKNNFLYTIYEGKEIKTKKKLKD